jgi:hypothetical protein
MRDEKSLGKRGGSAPKTWGRLASLATLLILVTWWIARGASETIRAPVAAVPEDSHAVESGEVAPTASRAIVEVMSAPEIEAPPTVVEEKSIPERFPAPPGVPGQLPFESGSIEERAWILRRALHDLQEMKHVNQKINKMGDEMLPVAIGGILDLDGRGVLCGPGRSKMPRAGDQEWVFMSQNKYFVFRRHEFPDYDLYRAAKSEEGQDLTQLGDQEAWLSRTIDWIEGVAETLEARSR